MSIAVKCAGVLVILIANWRPFFKTAAVTNKIAVSIQYICLYYNVIHQLRTDACVSTVDLSRKPVKFCCICDLVRVSFCTNTIWHFRRNRPCPHGRQHHCRTHAAGNIPVFTAAYRAIRIGFFLCAFCVTDTLWFFRYLRVADFTYISARCPCCCGNITAASVMFMLAVQFFCDTAAFLAALMGTAVRCFFISLRRQNTITVTRCRMLMNAFRYQSIAILRVFMTARRFCRPFAVAASAVMLGVVFTQPAYGIRTICIHYGRHQRHQHAQADKRRKNSFSHGFLLPLFPSNSVSNNTNPFRPLFLDRSYFSE